MSDMNRDVTLGKVVDYIEDLHRHSKERLERLGVGFITALPDGYAKVLSTIKKCYSVYDCNKGVDDVVPDVLVDSKTVTDLSGWLKRRIWVTCNTLKVEFKGNSDPSLLQELSWRIRLLGLAAKLIKRADANE